ncbi:iron-sulfur cluster assembly protein, partial [Nocardioides sp. NPDC006303]|uniref:iron-sulfur cluster assembly protein n=1 Tax=Nocardioides sp. NPDC006303 TaxID=3156747 RepID=UPI0033B5D0DB
MSLLTPESTRAAEAYAALHAVVDPELDEPITDLGFVRSLTVSPTSSDGETARVEAHLRLPTSFCSPNFAYLMASDTKDALTALPWTDQVVVELAAPGRCVLGGQQHRAAVLTADADPLQDP